MASGGAFSRLVNLWKGFLSLWVSGIEQEHPEIAYENAINGMVEKYAKLKQATASVIRRRDEIASRLERCRNELRQVEHDLNAAISTDQKDLGVVLIQKKNTLTQTIADLETESKQAQTDAENTKSSLIQVQAEINKLKTEKDRMLAKFQSARARLSIQESIEGISVDAEIKALENVRNHIQTKVAEAQLGDELASTDLDTRLAKLRQGAGEVNANDEWEKLKSAKAQSNSNPTRTL